MKWHHKILFFTFAVVALGLIVGIWKESYHQSNEVPTLYTGTTLPATKPFPSFSLTDDHNRVVDQTLFTHHWSLVFFGYTQCPELCPKTLSLMSEVKQIVGLQAPFNMFIISINPNEDTPDQLNYFLSQPHYKKGLLKGLTGNRDQIKALAETIGLYIQEDIPDVGHIEHSGTIIVINPKGELHALITKPNDPFLIAKDLQKLMQHHAKQV